MYEECEHIVITLNHIKTTIIMYNDWKIYILKKTIELKAKTACQQEL